MKNMIWRGQCETVICDIDYVDDECQSSEAIYAEPKYNRAGGDVIIFSDGFDIVSLRIEEIEEALARYRARI